MVSDLKFSSAILRISGPDANTYLQGQFTQDIRGPAGGCVYGLWLSQKGKVAADSFVLKLRGDEFMVCAWRVTGAALKERLESCLVADEVDIRDETAAWRATAVWGDGATATVAARYGGAPAAGMFIEGSGTFAWRGRFSRAENFIVLAPTAERRAAPEARADGGDTAADMEALEAERIRSGIPAVPDDIGPGDLPNEGGLDADAISYTKGCYLGQEVMSRLKNLGQVRRTLMVVAGGGAPPPARTPLHQNGKPVGETRTAARIVDGFLAMAMISLVNFDRAAPLALADGRALTLPHG